jgi:enoyl-CoA hydratase
MLDDLGKKLAKDFIPMQDNFEFLHYEEQDCIGILSLNRPDQLNALNEKVLDELRLFLESAYKRKLKGLIFTGNGEKAFIAGADIKEMVGMTEQVAQDFSYKGQQVTLMLEELRFPVIAAVNGFALGGGFEMALACDFIFCTENALFGLPEVGLGLIPGFGGTQRLAKIIGRNKAKALVYSAKKFNAQEAKELGVVLSIYPTKNELIEACKAWISNASKNSLNAIGAVKFVINRGIDLSNEEGLKYERSHFGKMFNSVDMQEGTSAFLEKRKPEFKGE